MRKLMPFLFVLLLSSCGAELAALIANVVAVATSAESYVNLIADFAEQVFAQKPDPVLQQKVHEAVQKARAAAAILADAAQDAEHLSKDELEAAFVAFRSAYQELLTITGPIGVQSATTPTLATNRALYGAVRDGRLTVPPAEHFKLSGDEPKTSGGETSWLKIRSMKNDDSGGMDALAEATALQVDKELN